MSGFRVRRADMDYGEVSDIITPEQLMLDEHGNREVTIVPIHKNVASRIRGL